MSLAFSGSKKIDILELVLQRGKDALEYLNSGQVASASETLILRKAAIYNFFSISEIKLADDQNDLVTNLLKEVVDQNDALEEKLKFSLSIESCELKKVIVKKKQFKGYLRPIRNTSSALLDRA